MNVGLQELKELLSCRGLKVSGVKEDLIARLREFEDNMPTMLSEVIDTSISNNTSSTATISAMASTTTSSAPGQISLTPGIISSPFSGIIAKTAPVTTTMAPIVSSVSPEDTDVNVTGDPACQPNEPDRPDLPLVRTNDIAAKISQSARDTLRR